MYSQHQRKPGMVPQVKLIDAPQPQDLYIFTTDRFKMLLITVSLFCWFDRYLIFNARICLVVLCVLSLGFDL